MLAHSSVRFAYFFRLSLVFVHIRIHKPVITCVFVRSCSLSFALTLFGLLALASVCIALLLQLALVSVCFRSLTPACAGFCLLSLTYSGLRWFLFADADFCWLSLAFLQASASLSVSDYFPFPLTGFSNCSLTGLF